MHQVRRERQCLYLIFLIEKLLLEILQDGQEHRLKECISLLADKFNLSDEDRKEKLSSDQSKFANRVGWARTYLKKVGLATSQHQGILVNTEERQNVLKTGTNSAVHPRGIKVRLEDGTVGRVQKICE